METKSKEAEPVMPTGDEVNTFGTDIIEAMGLDGPDYYVQRINVEVSHMRPTVTVEFCASKMQLGKVLKAVRKYTLAAKDDDAD